MDKIDSFFKDGLSIDETRVSVLIVTYVISFFVTVGMCVYMKDIEGLKSVLYANLGAVTGLNIVKSVTGSSTKTVASAVQSTVVDPSVNDTSSIPTTNTTSGGLKA